MWVIFCRQESVHIKKVRHSLCRLCKPQNNHYVQPLLLGSIDFSVQSPQLPPFFPQLPSTHMPAFHILPLHACQSCLNRACAGGNIYIRWLDGCALECFRKQKLLRNILNETPLLPGFSTLSIWKRLLLHLRILSQDARRRCWRWGSFWWARWVEGPMAGRIF